MVLLPVEDSSWFLANGIGQATNGNHDKINNTQLFEAIASETPFGVNLAKRTL
jgi:hypothetical protein